MNSFFRRNRPFIIAEMSGNHNQSLERAIRIVEEAASAGVDAIKLQTYTAATMTIDCSENEFFIDDKSNLWHGNSKYGLFQKAYTPWEWHEPIFQRCKECGIMAFSSPFDASAVDFLSKLGVPAYKIASYENVDLPLIRYVAKQKKPMLISTGMATVAELDECVRAARKNGCTDLTLLKCTSVYPANPSDSNLCTIPHLHQLFGCTMGISDHTLGIGVSVAAVAMGASVIERHFTLSRSDGGVDAAFSLEPDEMRQLVNEARRAFEALGKIHYGPTLHEDTSERRSIYAVSDIEAGSRLTNANIRIIRPGLGLSPKYYDILIGKRANCRIKRGMPIQWHMIG